jgi:hypothetical protein
MMRWGNLVPRSQSIPRKQPALPSKTSKLLLRLLQIGYFGKSIFIQ